MRTRKQALVPLLLFLLKFSSSSSSLPSSGVAGDLRSPPHTDPKAVWNSFISAQWSRLLLGEESRVGLPLSELGAGRVHLLSFEANLWNPLVKEPVNSELERSQECFCTVRFTQRSDSWLRNTFCACLFRNTIIQAGSHFDLVPLIGWVWCSDFEPKLF